MQQWCEKPQSIVAALGPFFALPAHVGHISRGQPRSKPPNLRTNTKSTRSPRVLPKQINSPCAAHRQPEVSPNMGAAPLPAKPILWSSHPAQGHSNMHPQVNPSNIESFSSRRPKTALPTPDLFTANRPLPPSPLCQVGRGTAAGGRRCVEMSLRSPSSCGRACKHPKEPVLIQKVSRPSRCSLASTPCMHCPVCGHLGLLTFWSADILVCGHFGPRTLWSADMWSADMQTC